MICAPCRARPLIVYLAMILTLTPPAHAGEDTLRITWQKVPVRIELATGIERIVHFPAPVTLGLPGALQSKLRAQSLDGSLYLKAVSAFEPSRVQVKTLGGGPVYLLDLRAVDGALGSLTLKYLISTTYRGCIFLFAPHITYFSNTKL